MRICVLVDETYADFDPGPFLAGYEWEMHALSAPVDRRIEALVVSGRFDVFLNLCEGYYEEEELEAGGPGYRGIEVVQALERAAVPYTGADSRCYDPSREEQQEVATARGIRFARGFRVTSVEEGVEAAGQLPFPVMVKHPRSYGSAGMLRESRCGSVDDVRAQVARLCARFCAARVEEFVPGDEYTVLVVENSEDLGRPIAYPPVRLVFPSGEDFWHESVKFSEDAPCTFERVPDGALAARLGDAAAGMFLGLGLTGYGRCDIRLDAAGEPVVLEINPNPTIMYPVEEYGPADWIILWHPEGYRGFFDRVFAAALARPVSRQSTPPAPDSGG